MHHVSVGTGLAQACRPDVRNGPVSDHTPTARGPAVHRSASTRTRHLAGGLVLGVVTLLVGLTTAPAARASQAAVPPRAMWVWSVADPAATIEVATAQGITTLFVA